MGVNPHAHVAAPLAFPPRGAPLRGQRQLHHHPVGLVSVLGGIVAQVIHLPVTVAAVQEDRALAEKVLLLEFPTLTEEGRQAALDRAYKDALWSPDGSISQAAVDTCMEVLTTSGLYEGDWDYASMVDMRFIPALTNPETETETE